MQLNVDVLYEQATITLSNVILVMAAALHHCTHTSLHISFRTTLLGQGYGRVIRIRVAFQSSAPAFVSSVSPPLLPTDSVANAHTKMKIYSR